MTGKEATLTPATLGFAIDDSVITHLEKPLLTSFAGAYTFAQSLLHEDCSSHDLTIMSSVPCSSDAITNLPRRLVITNSGDMADDLMAGNKWTRFVTGVSLAGISGTNQLLSTLEFATAY